MLFPRRLRNQKIRPVEQQPVDAQVLEPLLMFADDLDVIRAVFSQNRNRLRRSVIKADRTRRPDRRSPINVVRGEEGFVLKADQGARGYSRLHPSFSSCVFCNEISPTDSTTQPQDTGY